MTDAAEQTNVQFGLGAELRRAMPERPSCGLSVISPQSDEGRLLVQGFRQTHQSPVPISAAHTGLREIG